MPAHDRGYAVGVAAGGLLRTRNFALLWIGQSTSAVGSAITTVALPLVAISTLHASAAMVALLTAATWLPWLLVGLPAGVWVDRWPRRRTLLTADIVSAAVLVVIPIAAWTDLLTITFLLVARCSPGSPVSSPTWRSTRTCPSSSARKTSWKAMVVGPGLGGLVAQAAGAATGILIDAATFLVSAACLLGLRPEPEPQTDAGDRPGMLRPIGEGIGFIMRGRLLQAMLVVAAVTNFAMLGITALRVLFLVRAEGAAPGTAGFVIGVGSLGAILGAALAARASRRFGSARTYLIANLAAAPFVLLLPLGGHGWRLTLFAAGSFIALAGATVSNVMTMTFRGTFVPAYLLGRVTAASRIFGIGTAANPLTQLVWPVSGSPTSSPVARFHSRTVWSTLPQVSSVRPSGSGTAATARTEAVWPVSGTPGASGAVLHIGSTADASPQPAICARNCASSAANPEAATRKRVPCSAAGTPAVGSPAADTTAAHSRPCSPTALRAIPNAAASISDSTPGAANSSPNRPAAAADSTNRRPRRPVTAATRRAPPRSARAERPTSRHPSSRHDSDLGLRAIVGGSDDRGHVHL